MGFWFSNFLTFITIVKLFVFIFKVKVKSNVVLTYHFNFKIFEKLNQWRTE